MSNFAGKNILVIGGSSGIGLALVKQLTEQEALVYTASRNYSHELAQTGAQHLIVDVTGDMNALAALPEDLHGLVYCPGTINLKPFNRLTEADFMYDMQVNVMGAIRVLQAVLKQLKKVQGASVIFFSTVATRLGMSFHASVTTSKSALEGLAISLAAEYAPNKIRVNVIAPSLTQTPLAGHLLSTPEKKEISEKRHPLGRTGTPEEIAALALFLLSDHASWMTGQIIGIDGGLSRVKIL